MELSCNGAGIPEVEQPITSPALLPARLQKKFGLHNKQGWKVSLFLSRQVQRNRRQPAKERDRLSTPSESAGGRNL